MNSELVTLSSLSEFECRVISLLARGRTLKQIAIQLGTSYNSIKHYTEAGHSKSLVDKVAVVENKAQLNAWWIQQILYTVQNLDSFFPDAETLQARRSSGGAQEVSEETGKAIIMLNSYIDLFPKDEARLDVLNRITELLPMYGLTIYDTHPTGAIQEKLTPIVGDLKELADELGDKQALAYSHLLHGITAYAREDYVTNRSEAYRAFELNAIQNTHISVLPIRHVAISSARLGDEKWVSAGHNLMEQALGEVESLDLATQIYILQTLGRSQGLAGDPQGMNVLADAWSLNSSEDGGASLPIEAAGLAKAILEIGVRIPNHSDRNFLEQCGNEGLALAEANNLQRQVVAISKYLELLLN